MTGVRKADAMYTSEEKMSKYYLIGLPHCGKSTLGRQVAEVLELPFFDTDIMVKDRLELTRPSQLFSQSFHREFMYQQYAIMTELAELDGPAIIATGAEIALMSQCVEIMKNTGIIIHIQRTFESLTAEATKNGKPQLVLYSENGTTINMQEETVKLYAKELYRYKALTDVILENNGSEEEGVEKLVALINSLSLD